MFGISFFYLRSQGEGVTPLMIAAKEGDVSRVKELLEREVQVDQPSKYGWTALMFASWQGHPGVVDVLLAAGADPDVISGSVPSRFETVGGHPPSSALREAISNGHIHIARKLLDAGAQLDPESVAHAGHEAELGFLQELLVRGADLNTPSRNAFYPSALCTAAKHGRLETVRWLLEKGADPNLVAAGQTALKEAISGTHLDVVKLLLDSGADPNVSFNDTDRTALFYAATSYHRESDRADRITMVQLLLNHGADANLKSFGEQHTPLEFVLSQRSNSVAHAEQYPNEKQAASLAHKDELIRLLEAHSRAKTQP